MLLVLHGSVEDATRVAPSAPKHRDRWMGLRERGCRYRPVWADRRSLREPLDPAPPSKLVPSVGLLSLVPMASLLREGLVMAASGIARRCLLLFVAFLGLALPLWSPASSSEFEDDPRQHTVYVNGEALGVVALGGDQESSTSQLKRLHEFESELAVAKLEVTARHALHDKFAGLWTDSSEAVHLALTSGLTDEDRAALSSAAASETLLNERIVPRTLAQLDFLQSQMIADRVQLQSESYSDRLAPLASTSGQYDLDISIQTNQVVVLLPEVRSDLKRAFTSLYGPDLAFEQGSSTLEACSISNCFPTMMDGLKTLSGGYPAPLAS